MRSVSVKRGDHALAAPAAHELCKLCDLVDSQVFCFGSVVPWAFDELTASLHSDAGSIRAMPCSTRKLQLISRPNP